jgi:hypothetical protein
MDEGDVEPQGLNETGSNRHMAYMADKNTGTADEIRISQATIIYNWGLKGCPFLDEIILEESVVLEI